MKNQIFKNKRKHYIICTVNTIKEIELILMCFYINKIISLHNL